MDNKMSSSTDAHLILIGVVILGAAIYVPVTDLWSCWMGRWELRMICCLLLGLIATLTIALVINGLTVIQKGRAKERAILGPAKDAVFCGLAKNTQSVFIKPKQRIMHTQVVGTTNAGKTESVILPWAIQDMKQGRGLMLIDGKSDRGLLNKLWAYAVQYGREKDFKLFALGSVAESQTFNPLIGGSPEEVAERVFNAFNFENEFYRSIQFEVLVQVLRVFDFAKEPATFLKLHQAISNPVILQSLVNRCTDKVLSHWLLNFRNLPGFEREQRTSGLLSQMSHFAFGSGSRLFNSSIPEIDIARALEHHEIIYFQLPVLLSPFMGAATGKLVLQSLQSAIAKRHRDHASKRPFYSVFLDDFTEYLYPGFVSILNKSRSANIGVVFAHQALGDIEALGDSIANAILTNSNLKIFMRGNDPDSAEHFAKIVGTKTGLKITERRQLGILTDTATGDVSSREVEEFIIHPNYFKRSLGVGEAVMVIPHDGGSQTVQLKFSMLPDLPVLPVPNRELPAAEGFLETAENHCLNDETISEVLNKQVKEPYAAIQKTDLGSHDLSSSRLLSAS